MGADRTLVDAAFKLGASEAAVAVPNMKPLYDSNLAMAEKAYSTITGAVNGVKKSQETIRIARDKQLKGFTKIADQTYDKLYTMDEGLPEKVVTALRNEIESLQADFESYNTYGKNDTRENNAARTRITGELKRITNSVVKTRTAFMDISGDAKDWNRNRVDPANIATLQSFLNIKDMDLNDDITVEYIKGELTFKNAITGKSFTAKGMRDAVPSINKGIQTFSTGRLSTAQKAGKTDGYDATDNRYKRDEVISAAKSEYMSEIMTDEDFMNASTIETVDGVQPFKLALMDHEAIPVEIIRHMYYDEGGKTVPIGEIFAKWDKVVDGVVDGEDMGMMSKEELVVFEENHKRMISALTNVYDDAFDLQTSKSLFADYAVDAEKQAYDRFYTEESTKREARELTASEKAKQKADKLKASQYQIGGPSAEVRNPATGLLEPTGYKYDKNGNLLFDDSKFLKNIQTGIQTKDYFGNRYEPVLDRKTGKVKGFSIYDAIGDDKKPKYMTVEKILGFGYQAGLKVDFDPNSYKK
jgi:hypothetical protein